MEGVERWECVGSGIHTAAGPVHLPAGATRNGGALEKSGETGEANLLKMKIPVRFHVRGSGFFLVRLSVAARTERRS